MVPHVPAVDPVPAPHEPLSQSVALWQASALVEHLPAVELVPLPQVPVGPQSLALWHTAPAAHVPPPQLPLPQVAEEWQAIGLQVMPAHAPPLQSSAPVQVQAPPWQVRPVPQSASLVHVVCWHEPGTAPAQAKLPFGQSELAVQGSEH